MSSETSAAIIGAILGPTAGLIGTKLKSVAEKRDAKKKAKQLIKEATDLLDFADTLRKSAAAGGLVAKVPMGSIGSLESSVVNRINEAIGAICGAGTPSRRDPTKTVLDRVLLMHRPFKWWGWLVHGAYYVLAGILVLVVALVIQDYRSHDPDREGGLIIGILVAILAAAANVAGNVIARRHYEEAKAAAPDPCVLELASPAEIPSV